MVDLTWCFLLLSVEIHDTTEFANRGTVRLCKTELSTVGQQRGNAHVLVVEITKSSKVNCRSVK